VLSSTSVTLPPDSPFEREITRPPELRQDGFIEALDARTVFDGEGVGRSISRYFAPDRCCDVRIRGSHGELHNELGQALNRAGL